MKRSILACLAGLLTWAVVVDALDISEPLGAVDRRQRGAGNVRACAHRHLEQISGVVSPDISADDCSSGARGCAAGAAPGQ